MSKKYTGLRIIKWIIRVIGVLWLGAGVILGIFFVLTPTPNIDYVSSKITFDGPPAVAVGIATLVTAIIIAILLEGFAELLTVLIDTEENTRLTGALLKQMIRNQNKVEIPKGGIRSLLDTEPEF